MPVRRGDSINGSLVNKVIAALRPYVMELVQPYRMSAPRPRFVKNTGGTEITAWSPMEITSVTGGVYNVSRPTADDIQPGLILFTRDYTIATNATGFGYSAFDEPIQVETDSDTVTAQSEYGTQTDSFELLVGGSGFVCLGAGEDADAMMRPFRSSGGGVPLYTSTLYHHVTTGATTTKSTLNWWTGAVPDSTGHWRAWRDLYTHAEGTWQSYLYQEGTEESPGDWKYYSAHYPSGNVPETNDPTVVIEPVYGAPEGSVSFTLWIIGASSAIFGLPPGP